MARVNLPLHRAGEGGDQLSRLLKEADPLAVVVEVVLLLNLGQTVVHSILAVVHQPGKSVPAVGLDELVRVLGPGHPQHLHLQPRLLQDGDGPLGRRHPGPVSVIGDNGLLEVAGKQLAVFLRQGGAQRGHRVVKARLMEGDGVHIPLGQDDTPRL